MLLILAAFMSNTFGNRLRLTTWGESHGTAIGGVIDGFPSGFRIDNAMIDSDLRRRATGNLPSASSRKETDRVEFLSGLTDGMTLGTPIAFMIRNSDCHSGDYEELKDVFRPSHADYTYQAKYGLRDWRGGGRASARETAVRVVAGAMARQWLMEHGVTVSAFTSRVGKVSMDGSYTDYELDAARLTRFGTLDRDMDDRVGEYLASLRSVGDTVGGTVTCVIRGLKAGVGEPLYDKLSARLAYAVMSIPAAKGFDYGVGFDGIDMTGSEQNDAFVWRDGEVHTLTNRSGGIQGGISNGEDVCFRVVFKPIPSIAMEQSTVNATGDEVSLQVRGRHDVTVFPRVLPVVEAMAALTVMDLML